MPEFVPPRSGDRILGKYVVEHVLGQGGMSVVLAARHRQLDQRVAIKILSTGNTDEREFRRILREARAAVKISSDHIARVLDFGTDESDRPCIVMEYLEGEDLGCLVREGPRPIAIADAVGYVLHACEALAAAHAADIIHRDLKPENLFLSRRPDGTPLVKVLDFGISKMMGKSPREGEPTTGNLVVGSVPYMSPEQLSTPRLVDARADVWGIGVVLYELIAGRPPFTADEVGSLVTSIMSDAPIGLRVLRPDVPPELEAVVMRCLVKPAAERMPGIRELAAALAPWAPPWARPLGDADAIKHREPSSMATASRATKTVRVLPRRARWAVAVCLPALVALGIGLFARASRAPAGDPASAIGSRPAAIPESAKPIIEQLEVAPVAAIPVPAAPDAGQAQTPSPSPAPSPRSITAAKRARGSRRLAAAAARIATPQPPRPRPAPEQTDPLEGRK